MRVQLLLSHGRGASNHFDVLLQDAFVVITQKSNIVDLLFIKATNIFIETKPKYFAKTLIVHELVKSLDLGKATFGEIRGDKDLKVIYKINTKVSNRLKYVYTAKKEKEKN
ncbi:hypothetical protein EIN_009900 [Entamoeba invadens IP1]|uniref:Uncharacterized protein n=1 Tax=Entamoeba invadens IP1 TaxID=370355 RepID=L7FLX5_ENTIV|nr:hypothetical protein EIN_009900 [Entamoeba invadens IP1]ELP87673.1 hypothetical protein EIN_009900 [Entamoeba invadens IP1]|eukprot:XP_004254444.1 hypothetical protein EIN_009900 [Entamoeba invadens IP1]